MHLTAIRLAGFKSFADNTTFPVDAPLTGIIGPNGCGKSNIIDAVRWVLGETAAKQLRGQAMTDVIFAGAANRRGAAQASVALHFDNSDGKAGGAFADYAELVIARKVQSDGQSQYSINGKRVRRRDIVELLQGTGVGARSYAVIEQGMISRIIEAKPEELRVFIEEAAGIALYKTRRKESETRMNEARDHLTRHDDRLHQLGKQRDKLAQEAETAKTWRALQAQAQTASHQLQSWQYHQLHRQHEAAQEQYSRDRAALNDLFAHSGIDEAQIAALEEKLAVAKAAHHAAENAALQSAARLAALRRELESGRQNQQHLAQNARDQQTRLARLSQQHHEDHEQAQQHQAEISRLQAELAERAPALEAARLAAEHARATADQQHHQLDAQREHRHHAENRHYSAAHRLNEARQQQERLEQRRASLQPAADTDDDTLEAETLQTQHDTLAETLIALEDAQQQTATTNNKPKPAPPTPATPNNKRRSTPCAASSPRHKTSRPNSPPPRNCSTTCTSRPHGRAPSAATSAIACTPPSAPNTGKPPSRTAAPNWRTAASPPPGKHTSKATPTSTPGSATSNHSPRTTPTSATTNSLPACNTSPSTAAASAKTASSQQRAATTNWRDKTKSTPWKPNYKKAKPPCKTSKKPELPPPNNSPVCATPTPPNNANTNKPRNNNANSRTASPSSPNNKHTAPNCAPNNNAPWKPSPKTSSPPAANNNKPKKKPTLPPPPLPPCRPLPPWKPLSAPPSRPTRTPTTAGNNNKTTTAPPKPRSNNTAPTSPLVTNRHNASPPNALTPKKPSPPYKNKAKHSPSNSKKNT